MKTKTIITVLLIYAVLVSCAPAATVVSPMETTIPTSTSTVTPAPTAAETNTPTVTPKPTPMGGGVLKIAFIGWLDCGTNTANCLVVGDFFTGNVDFKIPLQGGHTDSLIKWSPDGKYLFYQDDTEKQIEAYIINVDTKKSSLLGAYPARRNNISYISWSKDSKHIIYTTRDANISKYEEFIANIDGSVTTLEGHHKIWLPDNQTVISDYGTSAYNIQTKKDAVITDSQFSGVAYSENFIVSIGEKGELELIQLPKNISDLKKNVQSKITLATFEAGLELLRNGQTARIVEISDNFIILSGDTNSNKGRFSKIIDLRHLPVTITASDLTDEYPIIISPDKSEYLSGFCVYDESCKNYDPNWRNRVEIWMGFKLWNIENLEMPAELSLDNDLIQFKSSAHGIIGTIGQQEELRAIDFYWQP